MRLLLLTSWSWSWMPGGACVQVANLSPSLWVDRSRYFVFDGRRHGEQPGSKAGPQGKRQANHRQPVPWSTRARVSMTNDASRILAKEKEIKNVFKSFKPSLKAFWARVWVCVRCMLPSGTACLWDLPAFLQEGGGDEKHPDVMNPHLNITLPHPKWLNKSEIDQWNSPPCSYSEFSSLSLQDQTVCVVSVPLF